MENFISASEARKIRVKETPDIKEYKNFMELINDRIIFSAEMGDTESVFIFPDFENDKLYMKIMNFLENKGYTVDYIYNSTRPGIIRPYFLKISWND